MVQEQPEEVSEAAAWRSEVRAGSGIPCPTTEELAELEAKWSAFSQEERTSVETSWSDFCKRCVRRFPRQHPSDTRRSPNYKMYRIWAGVRTHDQSPDGFWFQLSQVARFAGLRKELRSLNARQICAMLELLAWELEQQERTPEAEAPAGSLRMPASLSPTQELVETAADPEQARRLKVLQHFKKGTFVEFYRPLGVTYRAFHAWFEFDWKRCGKKMKSRLDAAADRLTGKL